mmetsp:Transcript_14001/g.34198  ORF Transcript_14001/g.34198 Transcript_14001/m.34198 type:complete len:245 (-) Transcript_14001:362-1096(-)
MSSGRISTSILTPSACPNLAAWCSAFMFSGPMPALTRPESASSSALAASQCPDVLPWSTHESKHDLSSLFFISISRGSTLSSSRTIPGYPPIAARCSAVFPSRSVLSTLTPCVPIRILTTSSCPFSAAACRHDSPNAFSASASVRSSSTSTCTIPARPAAHAMCMHVAPSPKRLSCRRARPPRSISSRATSRSSQSLSAAMCSGLRPSLVLTCIWTGAASRSSRHVLNLPCLAAAAWCSGVRLP